MSGVTDPAGDYRALYQAKVQPAVAALEAMRIVTFAGAIVGGFLVLTIGTQVGGAIAQIPFLAAAAPALFFLSLAGAIGVGAYLIWRLHNGLHCRLMKTIAGAYGLDYAPGGASGGLAAFTEYGLAPGGGLRVVHGTVRGEADGAPFEIVEISESHGIGKSRFTTFHGFLGRATYPNAFPATVMIKRDGMQAQPRGLQRVGLVDSDFERRFEVWSDDQIEARVLLDPTEIEHWVRLDDEIGGRLQCVFAGHQVLWSIITVNLPSGRDAWPAAHKSLNKPQWIEALSRDLYATAQLGQRLRPADAWLR